MFSEGKGEGERGRERKEEGGYHLITAKRLI
jgi:hypothetical protein